MTCLLSPCWAMCVCNLLYIQEWGHSRCAYYCYLFACCAWFILWGDRGEGRGALSNEAPPPHPRKRTHFVCSWVPDWAAGGASPFIFSFISFHAVPFLVSGSAGQDPYPNVFISSCFAGMPFLISGVPLESKFSSTFHACLSRSCVESTASALASSECVRFWIFPSRGQIPGTSGPIPTQDAIKSSGQESPIGTICIGSGCDVCFVRIIEFILFFLTQRDHLHRR